MEYEYSFKVDDIKPYINYCKENGFEKVKEFNQIRTLYISHNKILARITTQEENGIKKSILDFKDDNDSDEILKISRETIPLKVTEENKESIMSILDILGYKIKKELVRKRYVYVKDKVKFEIDDYTSPEIMHVVAIEGEKEQVDKIYNKVREML